MKRWNVTDTKHNADFNRLVSAISEGAGLRRLTAQVLASRGIKSAEEAQRFINGGEISSPMLMADMEKGVEIIKAALHSGEKIMIFGDYDCDGVTSTAMLYQYLAAQGGEVEWYIPSRDEGYGLSIAAIDEIADKGVKLIITVDNGISSVAEAAYIKKRCIKLIITDHHTCPDVLPEADAIINPKRPDDNSPFKELAGCGVVLKLIMALEDDIDGVLEQFSDLAALGTIGDVVPLTGENRVIVKRGLEIMAYTENIGLHKLLRQCGFLKEDEDNDKMTATALAFSACPRINATGRFAHAKKGVELLTCENEKLVETLSEELCALNNSRRDIEDEILKQIDAQIRENPALLSERVLVLRGENWHKGVIGIISSRLLNKWGKPTVIISDDGELLHGSARSVEGFPLVPLLDYCNRCGLLEKYGGHVKAAGFTAKSANYAEIDGKIKDYSKDKFPEMPSDVIHVDRILTPEDLNLGNVESLKDLSPFGEGNPTPVFLMQNCVILSKNPLKSGKYMSFNVRFGTEPSVVQKILNFNCSYEGFAYENGQKVDILVTLDINEYNGTKSVSATLKGIRTAGFNQDRYRSALRTYEGLIRGEATDEKLFPRILPEKDDIKIIYDILRIMGSFGLNANAERVYDEAQTKGLNYCKFRVILDVLGEFKLIEHDIISGDVKLLPASGKADIENSKVLEKVKALAVK